MEKKNAYEWLRRSRTLLYDAYWPPFYPELGYTAERGVAVAKRLHADVIRFGTIGKWALYPSRVMPRHPALGKRDLLGETVRLSKKAGIRVMAYIPVGHGLPGSWVSKRKPSWRFLMDDGKSPEGICHFGAPALVPICTRGEYRRDILRIVREIVFGYDVDGIYLDGPYQGWIWDRHACQCGACRDQYRRETGQELPTNAAYAHRGEDARTEARVAAHADWTARGLIGLLGEIRAIVKEKGDLPLLYNGCATDYLPGGRQDELIANADGFLMESHRGGVKGVGRGIHYGKLVWNYTHRHSAWPRQSHPRLEEENALSGYIAVAQGATPIVSYAGRFLGSEKYGAPVAGLFAFLEKNRALFDGTRAVRHGALLSVHDLRPGGVLDGGKRIRHDEHLYGVWNMLSDHGRQTTVLPRAVLSSQRDLEGYDFLSLHSVAHLSAEEGRVLADWVRGGGGLVVTGETSLYDARGKRLPDFSLAPLFGASAARPTGAVKEALQFHWWGQIEAPWDLYLKPRPALRGLSVNALGHLIVPELVPVRPKGAVVLADLVTGHGEKALLPAVLFHRYGKGKVCLVPGPIEKCYADNDRDLGLSSLLAELVGRVSRAPAPYRVEGARGLFLHMTEKPGFRFLHLVDENLDRPENGSTIYLPLSSGRPKSIRSLVTGRKVPWKKSGNEAVINGHRYRRHECLAIET
ncbi:MAG: hypothetical protein J0L75_15565 [Spirochaetes bacterium]|nr:hypothetical protein [Spirochaetota bacterium]